MGLTDIGDVAAKKAVVLKGGALSLRLFLIFAVLAMGALASAGSATNPNADRLPPLMVDEDGNTVEDESDWERRREEMAASLQYFQYGHLPPRPDRVVVQDRASQWLPQLSATEHRMTLVIGSQTKLQLRMALYLPKHKGPYPVLIREEHALGHTGEVPAIIDRGYAFVEYAREDLDPDQNDMIGSAQRAYPEYDWATLAVWAWGAMRVVDYLESRDDILMDQVGVIGHSRGGKMALLAGALDERFALVVANGSGAGGAGSYVIQADGCETLELITRDERFGYWFHSRLRWFMGRENELPFDQHFLKALVAPRALLCTEANGDQWANPLGTWHTHHAAREAYDFLGVRNRIGIHFRDGQHDLLPEDWEVILDFADWHLRGRKPVDEERFWRGPRVLDERMSPQEGE